MNPSDAIEAIEKPLSSLPYSLSRHILEHLRKLTSHEPVIGIMGKSGAGKSSLCNALFQGEVTPVSDVHAGTREVRRFRLSGHGHSMIITDLPGVGESRDRDAEYEALYRDILPELDLVLWLIKADDRALSVDEYFWPTKRSPAMNGIWPAFSLLPHRHRTFGRKRRRYSVCSGPYIRLLPYRPAPAGNWIRWSVRS